MRKVAIVMAFEKGKVKQLGAGVSVSQIEYCRHWGCKVILDGITDKTREPYWSKIKTIQRAMELHPDIEWFWWLDADTIITSPHKSVAQIALDPVANLTQKHMVLSKDCNELNAGSFLLRNSEWSRLFLAALYLPDFERAFLYPEQGVINYYYDEMQAARSYIEVIPQRLINSYFYFACGSDPLSVAQDDDLVVHIAGCAFYPMVTCDGLFADYMENRTRLSSDEQLWKYDDVVYPMDTFPLDRW